jgi:hypothetical protein
MKLNSNKTILLLLAVALGLTILSTAVTMSKLSELKVGYNVFTGAAIDTASGISTLTIQQSTSVTNNHPTINFGSGFVNGTCSVCNMDSNGIFNATCCVNFNSTNNRGFLIENTGNINISVNYTCSGSCNGTSFVNGTNPGFQLKLTANSAAGQTGEQGTTDTVVSCGNSPGLNFTTYKEVSNNGEWLCGTNLTNNTFDQLSFEASNDAFVVDLNVSIPEDALSGGLQKTATFTFNALATG